MSDLKEVLKVRKYKAGYEIRDCVYDYSVFGVGDITVKRAYTSSGDYIGESKTAFRLCKQRGIAPEKISKDDCVCRIGKSSLNGKWYGWSHRAIFGFNIGSTTKKGDYGYTPSDPNELIDEIRSYYFHTFYKNVRFRKNKKSVTVTYLFKKYKLESESKNVSNKICCQGFSDEFTWEKRTEKYPLGRGEWLALNPHEAMLMAIDFANGVS